MKEEMKVYNYGGKCYLKVLKEIDPHYTESVKSLNTTVNENEWMLKHLYSFRPWDSMYNTCLFADSIDKTADYMIHKGHTLNGERYARRMKYAAYLMRVDYGDLDQPRNWLADKVTYDWSKHRLTAVHPFKSDKRYEHYRRINYRKDKENHESRRNTMWTLFRKYYECLWD